MPGVQIPCLDCLTCPGRGALLGLAVEPLVIHAEFSDEGAMPLSRRELQILRMIAEGLTTKEIARRLDRAENTVKNHVTGIFSKLGVHDRTEAAIYAIKRGWLSLDLPEAVTK